MLVTWPALCVHELLCSGVARCVGSRGKGESKNSRQTRSKEAPE